MEVESLSDREVVKREQQSKEEAKAAKIDPYAGERERRAAVVFADWQWMMGVKEDKRGEECEVEEIDPDVECQLGFVERVDDSDAVKMEVEVQVEEMKMDSEVLKKRELKGTEEGEAAKEIIHEGKRDAKADRAAEENRRLMEEYEKWKREEDAKSPAPDPEKWNDYYAFQARSFEQWWTEFFGWAYGSFNDETKIPCMRLTNTPGGSQFSTLQVFSVRVAEIHGDLQWPLFVFGTVALRDTEDHNRNIIFDCDRDNYQTLTEKDPCLVLTGPVRAVILCDRVYIQVSLYARGTTESEYKEISLLAVPFRSSSMPIDSILINEHYTSRLTTLEFALGHIAFSVEATIGVEIIHGSWPDGFHGQFTACTAMIDKKVVLLDSGGLGLHAAGDEVKLSRRVVSVECDGKLIVSVKALKGDKVFLDEKDFTPQEMGTCYQEFDIGPCRMKVTVAWSLF
ncbi:unnamed protein product [Urochloa humidicola]